MVSVHADARAGVSTVCVGVPDFVEDTAGETVWIISRVAVGDTGYGLDISNCEELFIAEGETAGETAATS